MIGKLRGRVDSVREDSVVIDVGGVGYLVFCAAGTLDQLRGSTDEVVLYIETHVREDHIHLYGFSDASQQDYFNMLTTVQGVGNRMGLAVLSVFSPADIQTIILAQDSAALTRVSGIGKRIAERMVTELKNKLPALGDVVGGIAAPVANASSSVTSSAGESSDINDAVNALEQLGYGRSDAHRAVAQARSEGSESLDDLIKSGLMKLAG